MGILEERFRWAIVAIGMFAVLAGCGLSSGTDQDESGNTTTDSVTVIGQQGSKPTKDSTQPTRAGQASIPEFKPTPVADGAYGDFSDETWTSIDFIEATSRIVDCVQDHGFSVTLIPPGDGISYQDVPADQLQISSAQEEECRRAMAIPEFSWPTSEELRIVYEYNVALNECLASLGFDTTSPPSFEVFQDSYTAGPWMAYFASDVGTGDVETMRICPQVPPGGFGAWNIGDPIEPLPGP